MENFKPINSITSDDLKNLSSNQLKIVDLFIKYGSKLPSKLQYIDINRCIAINENGDYIVCEQVGDKLEFRINNNLKNPLKEEMKNINPIQQETPKVKKLTPKKNAGFTSDTLTTFISGFAFGIIVVSILFFIIRKFF